MASKSSFWDRLRVEITSTVFRTQSRRNSATTALSVESLEARRLLSITPPFIHPTNGNLVVEGSDQADQVTVSEIDLGRIHVEILSNGETHNSYFSKSEISSLILRGNGGDDILTNQTDISMNAYGGMGDDTITGERSSNIIYGNDGDDRIVGGDFDDRIYGGAGVDSIRGGQGNDTIGGDEGNDFLLGEGGDDLVFGGDGDDVLDGGAGNDDLRGEAGQDLLRGGSGNDRLDGGDDDDYLLGQSGSDVLLAGTGNDRLRGGDGEDTLYGQQGNDILLGDDDNDVLYGNDGEDTLDGGIGDDTLSGGNENDTLYGGTGLDSIHGNAGDDRLFGGDDNDALYGNEGNDVIRGNNGDDKLYGSEDNDVLLGGIGNDSLSGGDGNDTQYGEEGSDTLIGETGEDMLYGGEGVDTLDGGDGNDVLYGGEGDDFLYGGHGADILRGEEGSDSLSGGIGDDTLFGDIGNDSLYGGDGNDDLNGEEGDDTLQGDEGNDQLDGGAGDDAIFAGMGNDIVVGGDGHDRLYGDLGDDLLYGNDGNDDIFGGGGDDILQGGADDDNLRGLEGNDQLYGDVGNDTLLGGDGHDLLQGNTGNDTLYGGLGNDLLFGGDGEDLLYGEAGIDYLQGDAGNDQLHGNEGNDTLLGDEGNDQLNGGAGSDQILGGTGNDELAGGDGNDLLIGGEAIDTLSGGEGDDILIGGTTSHSVAALDMALSIWSSTASYDQRRMTLESEGFLARLYSEVTVFDDYVPDSVTGDGGQDWFFLPGALSIYDPTGNSVNEVGHSHQGTQDHSHLPVPVIGHLPVVEGFAFIDSLDEIYGRQENEALHTLVPHAGMDSSRQTEHLGLFELVKYADVTHAAIASGNWSDPSNWAGGVVPGNGARVLVPIGVSITVDRVMTARLKTIRVDGNLSFATNANTQLLVDTMVVGDTGELQIGTAAAPISPNVTARLRFTNDGPIDRNVDPFGIGRGLITHGSVEMVGAEVTSYAEMLGPITAGTTALTLSSAPVGWKFGDQIVIAGTDPSQNQDEVRTIIGVSGNLVIVAPLVHDHLPPEGGLSVHVANLTRNIVIDSESSSITRRGHVMFMHNKDVQIQNAGFYTLGRTDKLNPINDSVVDENWNLVPGTGSNNRARYPVHFHRSGTLATGDPAAVSGSIVMDAPGWGYVNHSSYVEFIDNVSYGITGSGFVTEVGDEVGLFQGNLAMRTYGSGEEIDSRRPIGDFGHTGDGFWFQGAGIEVIDNFASGADNAAFAYYTEGLSFNGIRATYLTANLLDPSIANGAESIGIDRVPIRKFTGNTGYASEMGLLVRNHLRSAPRTQSGLIEDSTFWNTEKGVDLPYSEQLVLRNLHIVRNPSSLTSTGVDGNIDSKDIMYENLEIAGYYTGIDVARDGFAIVNGGTFTTQSAIRVRTANNDNRFVLVQGPITFNPTPFNFTWMREIEMVFGAFYTSSGIDRIFNSSNVTLNYGPYQNQRLYFLEQDPDAVVYPVPEENVPYYYIGLTSQEFQDLHGLTPGGELAPSNTYTVERIRGLLAPNN
ncbi:G8 domain-containing protein [Bythopirellula goksoeyrii]|uniref:Bifunctional hemolysin/adenylate cyclase n=1 Tax=Bythopirellula goksoeyrii TaxID=1400387 RepID=A0A5B9QAY0_9BACT|nr:G8 domain-containing protein [Bythopirellula goksoeyrii]QEG34710.1 Bifunctional hemolysin/adenylate cyclase precursor [Bythopirellula goksoeyrii]